MGLDRALADEQALRQLGVAQTLREQRQHARLANPGLANDRCEPPPAIEGVIQRQLQRLRVEQLRQFRAPFELAGLDPGLNLLAGPNEAGKSTLGRAIRAAFFERHRSTTVDDPVNRVGRHSSIAIGTDGLPVISYQDQTARTLRVIKCGTRTCQ